MLVLRILRYIKKTLPLADDFPLDVIRRNKDDLVKPTASCTEKIDTLEMPHMVSILSFLPLRDRI